MMSSTPDVPSARPWTRSSITDARRVQLCVLIDRGHRELPIEAAFVGRTVQTTDNEIIECRLTEVDKEEQVMLVERTA